MPRLFHRFLSQQTNEDQDSPLNTKLEKLILVQQQQMKWQRKLMFTVLAVAVLQIIFVVFVILS